MGNAVVSRPAVVLTLLMMGFPPAFGQGRQAGGESAQPVLDAGTVLGGAEKCPTRFDYLVLASFADAQHLLSLSTYRFRNQTGFSSIRLTGFQRVGYAGEPASDCRARDFASRSQSG